MISFCKSFFLKFKTPKSFSFRRLLFYGGGIFIIHLQQEPATLDPHKQRTTSFVSQNLYRNLYRYDENLNLIPDLARECTVSKKTASCTLKENLRWSDGLPLFPNEIVKSFERFLAKETKSPHADILWNIKNAKLFSEGKIPFSDVGIKLLAGKVPKLEFAFEQLDIPFLHRLASPFTVPVKLIDNQPIGSGPFSLQAWEKSQKITLARNKNDYVTLSNHEHLVEKVEFKLVEESVLALRMYEKGKIDYLPLVPTLFIPTWKDKPDFARVYLVRFDYIAFGPQLHDQPKVRELLAASLDYEGFQKLIFAEGLPGCSGLPSEWSPGLKCIYQTIRDKDYSPRVTMPPDLEYAYSLYAVEDLKRSAEWLQHSWKKNLGWNVKLKGMENKVILDRLRNDPPPIFRRALTPEFPLCMSVIDVFTSKHPDNYIRLKNPQLDGIAKKLMSLDSEKPEAKKLCLEGLSYLIENRYIVPLGPMSFATLKKPKFKSLIMNGLYQMDLTRLEVE